MNRYLIEVEHEPRKEACDRAVTTLLSTGSHFLTNADWGCMDGVHKGWFIVEADSKEEAKRIVPVEYRNSTHVISVVKFNLKDVEGKLKPIHE